MGQPEEWLTQDTSAVGPCMTCGRADGLVVYATTADCASTCAIEAGKATVAATGFVRPKRGGKEGPRDRGHGSVTSAVLGWMSMTAAVWTAIGLLAATSLGTLFSLGARIDALAARIDALTARVDARFDMLSARIDTFETRVDSRFDNLETRLDAHLDRHAG